MTPSCFGQVEPTQFDVDKLQERLNRDDHARVKQSLAEVGFHSAVGLLATYAGQATDLQEWMRDAQINTDRNLRLQYLAGCPSIRIWDRKFSPKLCSITNFLKNSFSVPISANKCSGLVWLAPPPRKKNRRKMELRPAFPGRMTNQTARHRGGSIITQNENDDVITITS